MFTKYQLEVSKSFLDILKGEVLIFKKNLSWDITSQSIKLKCSDGYSANLVMIGEKAIMTNKIKTFNEVDFEDGLVRLRFELMRHLNPRSFENLMI